MLFDDERHNQLMVMWTINLLTVCELIDLYHSVCVTKNEDSWTVGQIDVDSLYFKLNSATSVHNSCIKIDR